MRFHAVHVRGTEDGFGITTKEGQLDVEKSASFGFDRPFDPAKLESILEGSTSEVAAPAAVRGRWSLPGVFSLNAMSFSPFSPGGGLGF